MASIFNCNKEEHSDQTLRMLIEFHFADARAPLTFELVAIQSPDSG